ncbi:MAG: DUF3604 domain-containing protein [Pseudomonadales bacterium]|nr:DUF3604 domain-containing protein [Pseudomonadales bacterium]
MNLRALTLSSAFLLATYVSEVEAQSVDAAANNAARPTGSPSLQQGLLTMPNDIFSALPEKNATRTAFFGDLHVHTTYSLDAFNVGTMATPHDAYRYALGDTIQHPAGFDMTLRVPLDFYAVTDHAMYMGMLFEGADPSTELARIMNSDYLESFNAPENLVPGRAGGVLGRFIGDVRRFLGDGTLSQDMMHDVISDAWKDTAAAAEQYNKPGEFTTFVAYEYTTFSDDRGNLHRNVIFRDADKLPAVPFSSLHSRNPEDLWDWMDGLRDEGIESLAIPHNSNGSNGQMFKLVDWAGNPLDDAYSSQRIRNEPLIEITQIKGTSETHPLLSDNDEWAGFEIMPYRVGNTRPSEPSGSYAREALLNGLSFEDQGMENPFDFGFVGASDTHTAAIGDDESDFYGKLGLADATPQQTGAVPLSAEEGARRLENTPDRVKEFDAGVYATGSDITFGASGITGVWAEDNTRESIYNAFRRKETFATTGTRIKVRFFGGYDFTDETLVAPDMLETAYSDGVSMGSDLMPNGDRAPRFIVWATQDALSAPLQRLQVIKGWTVDGEPHEQVFDIACSDGLAVDPQTHRCGDNGAQVNLEDCSISTDVGAAELKTVWVDPDFDPSVRAFYYVRVLENPTCRWSTWDAIKEGYEPRPDFPATIQERAFTSPMVSTWHRLIMKLLKS